MDEQPKKPETALETARETPSIRVVPPKPGSGTITLLTKKREASK